MKSGIFASLDIGTTSIKVIVAEILNGQVNVIGVGNERSTGLSRGMIIDIDKTAESIRRAVEQAEDRAGLEINELIVGIPGNNLHINSCYSSISINQNHQEITDDEVIKVVKKAIEGSLDDNREGVNLTLEEFVVDGFDEIQDPRGMIGNRIEFKGMISSIPKSIMHNIRKAVTTAGYGIQNIILQPEAMSEVSLNEDERNFGAILIDLGGGQSSVSVIQKNQLKFSESIPEGGEYITKDISIVLNTSIKNAEKLKRDIGHAYSPYVNAERTVSVDIVGEKDLVVFKESYIAEIIEARLEQIFEQLKYKLDSIGANEMPSGIIISGGGASLPGVEYLAEEIFNLPVSIYVPDFMSIRYPTFTNGIGLVLKQTNLSEIEQLVNESVVEHSLGKSVGNRENIRRMSESEPEASYETKGIQSLENEEMEEEETISDKVRGFFSGFFE